MDKRTRRAVEKIAADAKEAWDEGGAFYAPSFLVLGGLGMKSVVETGDVPGQLVLRHVVWESALGAITAVGWRLNTWTVQAGVVAGQFPISFDKAFALFVREPRD